MKMEESCFCYQNKNRLKCTSKVARAFVVSIVLKDLLSALAVEWGSGLGLNGGLVWG